MPQIFLSDINVVKYAECIVPLSRVAKKLAPKLWNLLAFSPIEIYDYNDPGAPDIPLGLNWHDPLALFKLFFEQPHVVA